MFDPTPRLRRRALAARSVRSILTAALAGVLLGGVGAGAARAQDTRPEPPPGATRPAVTVYAGGATVDEQLAPTRLLREGSRLVDTAGRLEPDRSTGGWRFVIDEDDERAPRHELVLMPCALLEEMERMTEWAPDRDLVFRVTGDVFAYHRRNYLVLTHPPMLIDHTPRRPQATTPPSADPGATGAPVLGAAADGPPPDDADDSAEAIIRRLEQTVGPVARRPAGRVGSAAADITPLREGTLLVSRRGKVRRSARGTHLFVFDADAQGLADPPMVLVPCLLLERLERFARQSGEDATVLLSGQVLAYDGQNYLLPTVYRIPRLRTQMNP